jgi:hypothetical protein
MAAISAMQVSPVAPVFIRKPNTGARKPIKKTAENDDNWRREFIAELKAKPRDKDDPDYEKIIGLINKVVSSTLIEKTKTIAETIGKRADDHGFRMRVVNFVFDRGVSMPFYAKLLADMLVLLSNEIAAVHEDLQIYCSLDTFNKMFDQTKTIAFPNSSEPDFENRVCTWNKQKELRRGFGGLQRLHAPGVQLLGVGTPERELVIRPTLPAAHAHILHGHEIDAQARQPGELLAQAGDDLL